MAKKQLKVSMIFGGSYHTFGTVLEEDSIPLSLRKTKYLEEPREEDSMLSSAEEIEFDEEEEDLELPPPPPKRKR